MKQDPKVREEIDKAAGYAVFNTTNVNVVLLVVARGEGVLYDKRRKEPIFMQDVKTGEGLGAGYQNQYQIIIFKTTSAIDQFLLALVDGQEGGLDVEANFSAGSGGPFAHLILILLFILLAYQAMTCKPITVALFFGGSAAK